MNIVDMLVSNNKLQNTDNSQHIDEKETKSILYGFRFIQNHFTQAENRLEQYRNTISSQQNILQARFIEKAISGNIITDKDKELFYSYFPSFPSTYCLVYLKLLTQKEGNGNIYTDALSILQSFLQYELPKAYLQQMNNAELLLIIAQENYENYCTTLDFTINNVNKTESSYSLQGIASNFYQQPEMLFNAYQELQLLDRVEFPKALNKVCTINDYPQLKVNNFFKGNIMTLYTAISYGNLEMALDTLKYYTDNLEAGNRHTYELICSILKCIKLEYSIQLMNTTIPPYTSNSNLYQLIKETVFEFCNNIKAEAQITSDPFVLQVMKYIDQHYTEYSLCLTVLADYFECSASKIQKAFKKNMDITVSDYIEKKRMELANKLLLQKGKNISEIAQECGFSNSNSFYKAYQRVYGFAPSLIKEPAKKSP